MGRGRFTTIQLAVGARLVYALLKVFGPAPVVVLNERAKASFSLSRLNFAWRLLQVRLSLLIALAVVPIQTLAPPPVFSCGPVKAAYLAHLEAPKRVSCDSERTRRTLRRLDASTLFTTCGIGTAVTQVHTSDAVLGSSLSSFSQYASVWSMQLWSFSDQHLLFGVTLLSSGSPDTPGMERPFS